MIPKIISSIHKLFINFFKKINLTGELKLYVESTSVINFFFFSFSTLPVSFFSRLSLSLPAFLRIFLLVLPSPSGQPFSQAVALPFRQPPPGNPPFPGLFSPSNPPPSCDGVSSGPARFSRYRYENNSGLCGFPLPSCEGSANANSNGQHRKSRRRQVSLAGSVAMGLLFSLFCIGLIIVAVEARKRKRRKKESNDSSRDFYVDNSRSHSGTANSNRKLTATKEALSINLATFEKAPRKLTFADLLEATNGFHNDSLIGSGGFGDVYKAQPKDGSVVAIKKLIHVSGQATGSSWPRWRP